MLGRIVYRVRRRLAGGLRASWYREIVRPGILRSPPIQVDSNSDVAIHVMTSSQDWLNLIWALKSFYIASGRCYSLFIHDDGSLDSRQSSLLQDHFPGCSLISMRDADERMTQVLKNYPRCRELRETNTLAKKVFDFAEFGESERFMLLDSDVLFFSTPTELLRRLEDFRYRFNSVNADVESAYTVDPTAASEQLGFPVIERFNSGLGVIFRESIRLEWCEEFLALPGILGHFWRIEQTLYALCSSRFGVELLPEPYTVSLERKSLPGQSRHYVGPIRNLMYADGMRRIIKDGLFN